MEKKERPQNKHLIPGIGRNKPKPPWQKKVKVTVHVTNDSLVLVQKIKKLLAEEEQIKTKGAILREALECGLKVMAGNLIS